MLTAIAFALVAGQSLGPVIPPGTNADFQAAVIRVEERLEAGDFAGARKLLALLPKPVITIRWDDSSVPAAQRAEFAAARDQTLKIWGALTSSTFKFGDKNPDITFSFKDQLPNTAADLPAGVALFTATEPGDSRLEAVIGLKRGNPPQPIGPNVVHNEVAHAVGYYFGLSTFKFGGSYMGRTDLPTAAVTALVPPEKTLTGELLKIVQTLRTAVDKKTRMIAAKPVANIEPGSFDGGALQQGDKKEFSIQITNNGNAPLAVRVIPDCGCVSVSGGQTIAAGSSGLIRGLIDSKDVLGKQDHNLIVYSNDANEPIRYFPVKFSVSARLRVLVPGGVNMSLPKDERSVSFYVALADGFDLGLQTPRVDGVKATAEVQTWKGRLADEELGEPEADRTGYKVTVTLAEKLMPGRWPLTITIPTDNAMFPVIRKSIYLQQGIVALPDQVFVGEVSSAPRTFSFLVSRPQIGFKILGVAVDVPSFTVKHQPVRGDWEHRVDVAYDGKAFGGPIRGTIKVRTNDPEQPEILVPIFGSVK